MRQKSSEFIFDKEQKWETVADGLQRQIMGYDESMMMVKVRFEKGAIGTLHQHFHSQTSYVVSGKFELKIGAEKRIIESGDGFYVEPNKEHGVVCLEAGLLIDVFSPIRADFL